MTAGQKMAPTSSRYHKTREQLLDENAVVEAAKKDTAHFETLYNNYYEQIFRYIYQRIEDKETAFDLCSQVFLKAMTNLHKYEFRGVPFASWLYRIAQNEIYEALRQQKTTRVISIENRQAHDILDEIDSEHDEELYNLLLNLLPQLGEEDLEMVEMRFFEKRSFREIGEILGITENNAKVKGHRTIEKLKKLFKSHIKE